MHVTDASNASRTLLFDIRRGDWDDELLALLDIPRSVLPQVVASSGVCARDAARRRARADRRHRGRPAGGAVRPGVPRAGTGEEHVRHRLLPADEHRERTRSRRATICVTTVAWKRGGTLDYALEGSVFIAGAVVQWLRDGLQIIRAARRHRSRSRRALPDNGGVYFVPAFAGLGAPHWDPYARGSMFGLTRGTTAAHLARAALESIAFQSADVLDAMQKDAGITLSELRVDGGATANNLLMQFQADVLGVPVVRPQGARDDGARCGVSRRASRSATGRATPTIAANWRVDRRFEPAMARERVAELRGGWEKAVERAKGWAN